MKILFIGNFESEFSTENYHKKSFESLVIQVITMQENRTNIDMVMSKAVECDLVYWTHTHGWHFGNRDQITEMFKVLRECKIPSVGYHLDLWLGLRRERDLSSDPYWGIEHFFTVDKLMADWLNNNTDTKGYFLPAGVYEGECFIGKPDREKYPHDVIFTGSKGYHSEYPYRAQLIDWLHQTYGNRFAHYGGGGLPTVRGPELNNLYASAKVVVGDTLCKNFNYPWYSSDRLFEAAGRGACLVYPRIEGLDTFYQSQKEVAFYDYGNFDQLKGIIDTLVNQQWAAADMRTNALRRTLKEHTYKHRLETILKTLNLM